MSDADTFLSFFSFDVRPFLTEKSYEPGESIIRENEYPHTLYYLYQGRVKFHMSHKNGKVSIIRFSEAPCLMGEMELLDPSVPARGATAITPCRCFLLDTTKCREALFADAKFLRYTCLFLCEKNLDTVFHYTQSVSYPLQNRLAAFLLMSARNGVYRERHTEAAEYLGVTYRHFLYVLADFCKKGYLKKTPTGYLLQDTAALRALQEEIRPTE